MRNGGAWLRGVDVRFFCSLREGTAMGTTYNCRAVRAYISNGRGKEENSKLTLID